MATFKGKSSKDMYKNSPKIGKGADGKAAVEKGPTEAERVANTDNGQQGGQPVTEEAMPMPVRHASERNDLHAKHSQEHGMHDAGKHGDKKEMHARHEADHKAMHKKHEKEMAKAGNDDNDDAGPAQQVQGE